MFGFIFKDISALKILICKKNRFCNTENNLLYKWADKSATFHKLKRHKQAEWKNTES